MKNKKSMRKLLTGLLAIVMAACMLMGMATTAAAANQAVMDAKNGVVQIQIWFNDVDMANSVYLANGTGFIINDNTVVTCEHVVSFSDEVLVEYAQTTSEILGKKRTASEVKECLEIRVIVYRDVYVKASVLTSSVEMDYAVLSLEQSISGRKSLDIRDSATLTQTEDVYALGFPADMETINEVRFFDADAVTITDGTVNFVGNDNFTYGDGNRHENVNVVVSSAFIHSGNSGGPLLDENGAVVGINAATSDNRNFAISSNQLLKVLNALGIKYNPFVPDPKPTDPDPKPTDPVTTTTEPDSDPVTTQPTTAEPTVPTTKDEPKPEPEGLDPMIIAIAAVAVVVVILLIVLILNSKKKKAAPAPVPMAPAPSVPRAPQPPVAAPRAPMAPPVPARPATAETSVLNAGVGETTVLGAGTGETTVLTQSVNGGFLIRTSNNERIPINTADFSVGRERARVDYCIGGNTNISREHARFIVRNGITYIVDNKAANGTFVNGVKARPGQEIELKSGDKIALADESFEFSK